MASTAAEGGPPGGFGVAAATDSAPLPARTGSTGDDRAEATRLLRHFVTHAAFECLLVLRSSARNPSEVMLFVCEEDEIHLPDLRGFVSTFRIGLGPSEEASVDLVHNHPERLLIRTHSSEAASYSERRRLLGLHSLTESVVERQIQRMRSGALPCAVLPPSTEDLVTALKIMWLSGGQRVDVAFHIPDIGGRWRLEQRPGGWGAPKYVVERLLSSNRLYAILRGQASPRNPLEERYSELFREYYVLRNRIAQVFSEEAFGRFEQGDSGGIEQERLRNDRRLERLRAVALKLGIVLDFEPRAEGGMRPPPLGNVPPPLVVARD